MLVKLSNIVSFIETMYLLILKNYISTIMNFQLIRKFFSTRYNFFGDEVVYTDLLNRGIDLLEGFEDYLPIQE